MSVVAVKVTNDKWEIAADSICVRGWTQRKMDGNRQAKLFRVNDLVIGGVGTLEEIGLLRIYAGTRKPAGASEPSMMEYFSEFAEWKNKKTGKSTIDNDYIICMGSAVFYIEGFDVQQVSNFEAIGAGMDFALAAMHLGKSPSKAVETAIELSVFCEGPVVRFASED